MRYAEWALLMVPLAILIAWFYGVRGLSRRGIVTSVLGLLIIGLALFWMGEHRAVMGRYVPAQWQGGSDVLPGSGKSPP